MIEREEFQQKIASYIDSIFGTEDEDLVHLLAVIFAEAMLVVTNVILRKLAGAEND